MTSTSIRTIALTAIAALVFSLGPARPAAAWVDSGWDSGWGSGYSDYDYDESQEWAQENAREAGREKRRDELEKKKEAASAEHEAYYAELVNASKASLNAPQGVYYRKPGFKSNEAPGEKAQAVTATLPDGRQIPLVYDQGIFWLQRGAEYVVVIPPPGIVVDTLPAGVRAFPNKGGGTIYYFFGVYFQGKDGKYAVVKPPAGTVVGYLPDGYTQETVDDATIFKFGGTTYKQVFVAGSLAYQVV
jgi:hypothetical protein